MSKLYNRARVTVSSTGTGTLTLSTAVAGYQTFTSAGVQNGDVVSYVIEDGLNWEVGEGTYTSSTNTLTRTVTQSFNGSTYGTSPISVTASAQVFISPLAADIISNSGNNTLSVTNGGTGLTSLTSGRIPFGAGTSAFGNSANLFWDSANSWLGIGTSSPTASLTINGSITSYSAGTFLPQGIYWNQTADAYAGYLILQKSRAASGAGAAVSVNDYIGTLLFKGADTTGAIQNSSFISASVTGVGSGNVDAALNIIAAGSTSYLSLGTNNSERMRIDASGNVGIGGTPTYKLDVIGSGSTSMRVVSTTADANMYFTATSSNASIWLTSSGGSGRQFAIYSGTSGQLSIYDNTGASERMRIDASGNVGIGVSNPSATGKLSIVQSPSGTYGSAGIWISDNATTSFMLNTIASGVAGFWSSGALAFGSGANNFTERMRIDASGNVGIGTSSFGTSAAKVIGISTGTAPTTGPADTIQIYSTDLSAGNTMLSLYTEGTPVNANTTAATTHRIAIRVNGTVYYLLANTAA